MDVFIPYIEKDSIIVGELIIKRDWKNQSLFWFYNLIVAILVGTNFDRIKDLLSNIALWYCYLIITN